ncbi:Dual specificity protein phosphatase cdc14a [Dinochytrium kinnereticum]|nr:Dual specificity protein phosphatase cdc14a [Dinochytrium kinnereticum]
MPFSTALYNHSVSTTAADVLGNAREFIKNKLYFTSLSQTPHQYPNVHFFTIDNSLVYINFYSDFGPSNLAHVLRFCEMMQEKFKNPLLAGKRICLYSSMDSDKRANAAFLICAYMLLVQKKTPDEAYQPLIGISQPFLPYRDAGYGAATYHITILDCLRGMHKALQLGLLDVEPIDPDEYEFYERVENGDFNWITDKFIALASPRDDPPGSQPTAFGQSMHGGTGGVSPYASAMQTNQAANSRKTSTVSTSFSTIHGVMSRNAVSPSPTQAVGMSGASPSTPISGPFIVNGKKQFNPAYRIDDLICHLKERGVTTIVRLNNKIYDRKKFVDAGIEHVELYFPDGSTPPDGILKRFLELCETRPGVIAVHCKAGLGRTGTLIGAYLMKHYKFTAAEVIGLLRVLRPGSVVGPQQNYLQSMQSKLWKMQPLAKLPQAISMLKSPTFPVSRRFPVTEVHDIYATTPSSSSIPKSSVSRSATPAPRSGPVSRSQTPNTTINTKPRTQSSADQLDHDYEMVANDQQGYYDDVMADRSLENLAIETRGRGGMHETDYGPRPVTSSGASNYTGGYYQSLLDSGRMDAAYDPMDYEASGKLVDGDLPAQPRKHASPTSASPTSPTQTSSSAQIRRDLLSSAMNSMSQSQRNQKVQQPDSWKQRPASAAPSSSVQGSQRPASASYFTASVPPTQSPATNPQTGVSQTRYQLRSSGMPANNGLISTTGRNMDFSASNAERSRIGGYTSSVTSSTDLSGFVLTGTGKPMTPATGVADPFFGQGLTTKRLNRDSGIGNNGTRR